MKQAKYGLVLFLFLALPPVSNLMESIMIIHMHMQLSLLIVSGMLMAPFFQTHFKGFFNKWNSNGIPGIFLFLIIWSYWMIPRSMDEALTSEIVELFKFISLPFLAGVALRNSWKKIHVIFKNIVYLFFIVMFSLMAWIYIIADSQICNNYLLVEQKTLGWGSLAIAVCIIIYLIQLIFMDQSEFE